MMTRRLVFLILPLFLVLALPVSVGALSCSGTECQAGQICAGPAGGTQYCAWPPDTITPPSNVNTPSNSSGGLANPLKVDTIEEFLGLILAAAVRLGTILLILMLVFVGFLFVTAQGNEEKISNAKKALLWTVIGGLVLLGAQAISLVIQSTIETLK